jgi:hypothetical protein
VATRLQHPRGLVEGLLPVGQVREHLDRRCGVEGLVRVVECLRVAVRERDPVGDACRLSPFGGLGELAPADVDPGNRSAAALGHLDGRRTGAAADVQQVLVRLQAEGFEVVVGGRFLRPVRQVGESRRRLAFAGPGPQSDVEAQVAGDQLVEIDELVVVDPDVLRAR